MKLTDATQVRVLANGAVAVYEGTGPAKLFRQGAPEVWPCSWQVELRNPPAHDCVQDEEWGCWCQEWGLDGIPVADCGAPTVGFDNGFLCAAGHDHYEYGTYEYFDAEEAEGARKAGLLPANAKVI